MIQLSPRQWEVLQAVQEGRVWEHYPLGVKEAIYSDMDMGSQRQSGPRYKQVTAAVRVLDKNGLVEISKEEARFRAARKWIITSDGEALLAVYKTRARVVS